MKVPAKRGVIGNEIADVCAFAASLLMPGEVKGFRISDDEVGLLGTGDAEWNAKNLSTRRLLAAILLEQGYGLDDLTFSTDPVAPRRGRDHTPTSQEIRTAIFALCADSAGGPDGVTARQLRDPRLFELIRTLITTIWETKNIPQQWLVSYLIGIPKAHDTITRGIALTQVSMKVLASIIRTRSAGHVLLSSQFGFRTHKGTAQATLLLREVLNRRARAGKSSTTVFVDLSKAFDSMRRDGLIRILTEYGFGDTASFLVTQMYEGDVMHLYLNNQPAGAPIRPAKGVKQGCILSPMIFNMIVDRALRTLAKEFPNVTGHDPEVGAIVLAYADDTVLVARNDEEAEAITVRFADILDEYGLSLNGSKTKVMRTIPTTVKTCDGEGPELMTEVGYAKRARKQGMVFQEGHTRGSVALGRASKWDPMVRGQTAPLNAKFISLVVPSGNESPIACPLWPNCKYIATTTHTTECQDLLKGHVKAAHYKGAQIDVMRLAITPAPSDNDKSHLFYRPQMTHKQTREALPKNTPPCKWGKYVFESCEEFLYLGSLVTADGSTVLELKARLAAAETKFSEMLSGIGERHTATKLLIYGAYVESKLFFATETWAQTVADMTSLNATRMRHIRTLTGARYMKHLDLACPIAVDGKSCAALCAKSDSGTKFIIVRQVMVWMNERRTARILQYTHPILETMKRRGPKLSGWRRDSPMEFTINGVTCIHHLTQGYRAQHITELVFSFLGSCIMLNSIRATPIPPEYFETAFKRTPESPISPVVHDFSRGPFWGREILALPSQRSMLAHWNLYSTEATIAKRRLNLLASLSRDNAAPQRDGIHKTLRKTWWGTADWNLQTTALTLEDTHNITFWRQTVRAYKGPLTQGEPKKKKITRASGYIRESTDVPLWRSRHTYGARQRARYSPGVWEEAKAIRHEHQLLEVEKKKCAKRQRYQDFSSRKKRSTPILLNHTAVPQDPVAHTASHARRGIYNEGQTCHLNAAVKCLLAFISFADALRAANPLAHGSPSSGMSEYTTLRHDGSRTSDPPSS